MTSATRTRKEQMIKMLLPFPAVFLGIYIPVSFFVLHDPLTGWVHLTSLLLIGVCWAAFVRTRNILIISNVLAAVGIPVLLPWLFNGGPSGAGFWWSPIYVVWAFFITRRNWAIVWICLHLALTVAIVCLSASGVVSIAYEVPELMNMLFAYSITSVLVYFFNRLNEHYYQLTQKELNEKILAEAELLRFSERFLKVFENNPVGMIISNLETQKFQFVNDAFVESFGYTKEEAVGKSSLELGLIDPESRERILEMVREKGYVKDIEITVRRKNGETFPALTSVQEMVIHEQRFALTFFFDITERKKTEDALVKARVSERMAEILGFRNRQLTDFCNIISHNLRGPLANINMLVEYIGDSNDETERKEMLAKIGIMVNHLNEMVVELVESLEVEQDSEIARDRIELNDCLQNVLIGFEGQIRSFGGQVRTDFDNAPFVHYPQKYMDSLFTNLVSNWLKYKSPNRKPLLRIKTERSNGSVVLSVADNGQGIDMDKYGNQLFKIRKTFHDHPDAKGFGLFMTRTQVEAMGGKIWVESTPGEGTTFFVEFKNGTVGEDANL